MKAISPVHPFNPSDMVCRNCAFWHAHLAQEFIIMPDGQTIPKRALQQQGQIGVIPNSKSAVMAHCFFNPQWVVTADDSYCGHWVRTDLINVG